MSSEHESHQEATKENPKEANKQQPTLSDGNNRLAIKEAKSTSSVTSFEDFSRYRQGKGGRSLESIKMDSKTAKDAIMQLMKEQEAETARRIAQGVKYGSESSESINTTCRRIKQQMKQAKKENQPSVGLASSGSATTKQQQNPSPDKQDKAQASDDKTVEQKK